MHTKLYLSLPDGRATLVYSLRPKKNVILAINLYLFGTEGVEKQTTHLYF
jgi:hypothetical protein